MKFKSLLAVLVLMASSYVLWKTTSDHPPLEEGSLELASKSAGLAKQVNKDPVTQNTFGFLEIQIGMEMLPDLVDPKASPITNEKIAKKMNVPYDEHAHHHGATHGKTGHHNHKPVKRFFIKNAKGTIELDLPDAASHTLLIPDSTVALVNKNYLGKRKGISVKVKDGSANLKSLTARGDYELIKLANPTSEGERSLEKSTQMKAENQGEQRTLIIPFTHQDSASLPTQTLYDKFFNESSALSLSSFIRTWSQGLSWVVGQVAAPIWGPRCINRETSGTANYAIERIDLAGAHDLTQYDRVILLFPSSINGSCSYYMWGTIGKTRYFLRNGRTARVSVSWIYESSLGYNFHKVMSHEFGHNVGLQHASIANCYGKEFAQGGCYQDEYGDYTQYLGNLQTAEPYVSSAQIDLAGWANNSIPEVGPGTYTLAPMLNLASSNALTGIKIPITTWPYYNTAWAGDAYITVDYYNASENYFKGIYIRYHTGMSHTFSPLIYNTPNGSGGYSPSLERRLNTPGASYTDSANGVKITLVSISSTGANVRVENVPATVTPHELVIENIVTAREIWGGNASCRELYLDIRETVANAKDRHGYVMTWHDGYYLNYDNCYYYSQLTSNTHRYRCSATYNPQFDVTATVYKAESSEGSATHKRTRPAWACNEPSPTVNNVIVTTGAGQSGASCRTLTVQIDGNVPSGTYYDITMSDANGQAPSYYCNGTSNGGTVQCSRSVPNTQNTYISTQLGNSSWHFTAVSSWNCAGETPYQMEFLRTPPPATPSGDAIFSSGFDENSPGNGTCTVVKAVLQVNSRLSGQTITVNTRDSLTTSTTGSCTISVPVFSSGTKTVTCDIPGLAPDKEYHLHAKAAGYMNAHGFFGRWNCR